MRVLRRIFDRAPDRLSNGRCADCTFHGYRQVDGQWFDELYARCDWHRRHPEDSPLGPEG